MSEQTRAETRTTKRVHLSRWVSLDVPSNLARAEEEAARAAAAGADLCVFPESFLHGYTRPFDPAEARALFERASQAAPKTVFVFGSISEERRNRTTVWRAGREIARYDKIHLFEPNGERRLWSPGDAPTAVDLGDWRIGLVNCNDLRFPEQARALALEARVDALVVVAWWPWRRDHVFRTLLAARAMENGVFALGCCVASSVWPAEPFAGAGNHVFDPLGEPVRTEDDSLYELDLARRGALTVDTVADHVPLAPTVLFS